MEDQSVHNIAKLIPKTELHIHLDGSLSEAFIIEKSKKYGIDFDSLGGVRKYVHDLKRNHRIKCQNEGKLNTAEKNQNWPHFDFMNQFLQTKEDLIEATEDLCKQLINQNVWLAEIRFCPELHTLQGLLVDDIVESVVIGFNRGKLYKKNNNNCNFISNETIESKDKNNNIPFEGGIIICALRSYETNHFKSMIDLTKRWIGKGVVGFDIAGDEGSFPLSMHLESLQYAISLGIPITCHAGEWPNSIDNIRNAVSLGVNRIGHGITLIEDMELLREVVSKRIGVECCITGNVGGQIVRQYSEHPIRKMFVSGVRVNINSDNQLLSGDFERVATTVNDVVHLRLSLRFEWREIKEILLNGVFSSFTPLSKDWVTQFEDKIDSVIYEELKKNEEEEEEFSS